MIVVELPPVLPAEAEAETAVPSPTTTTPIMAIVSPARTDDPSRTFQLERQCPGGTAMRHKIGGGGVVGIWLIFCGNGSWFGSVCAF